MQRTGRRIAIGIAAVAVSGAVTVGCSNGGQTSTRTDTVDTPDLPTGAQATDTGAAPALPTGDNPTPAETPGAQSPGEQSEAADSTTISTPDGDFVVQGAILQKYSAVGGADSPLGLPTANEEAAPNGGRFSTFEGGAIYWSPQTGAHIVWGGIRDAWEGAGGVGGQLGYPTTDEQTVPGGWRQDFQGGAVSYLNGQPQIEAR